MGRLTQIGISGRAYPAGTPKPAPPQPLAARFPFVDSDREARVVQDVADLLHESTPSTETVRKIKRWIQHVLWDAEERRRWWFLEAVAARWVDPGVDVIDLVGHVAYLAAAWAPARLKQAQLPWLLEQRQIAARTNGSNRGPVSHYALEAGRRVHLWPAPSERIPFATLYSRPIHIALVPNNWEGLLLDGILGKYGRHFDRDALTQDPEEFERRYEQRLNRSIVQTGHHDLEVIERWVINTATTAGNNLSAAGGSTELLVPASLTGIGYQQLADGYYPLEVA